MYHLKVYDGKLKTYAYLTFMEHYDTWSTHQNGVTANKANKEEKTE